MPTRTRASASQPSLFPFLSVLFCLIGTMMFIGVGIAATGFATAATQVTIELASIEAEDDFAPIDKSPMLLECSKDTAKTLDGDQYVFTLSGERSALASADYRSTPFAEFLVSLASRNEQYLLFVVRPDGMEIFKLLRAILERRNDDSTTSVIAIPERPWWERASLPTDVLRKTRYYDGRLYFSGLMSPAERELLKALFDQQVSYRAVDRLFEDTRTATKRRIDFGSELVPAAWTIRIRS